MMESRHWVDHHLLQLSNSRQGPWSRPTSIQHGTLYSTNNDVLIFSLNESQEVLIKNPKALVLGSKTMFLPTCWKPTLSVCFDCQISMAQLNQILDQMQQIYASARGKRCPLAEWKSSDFFTISGSPLPLTDLLHAGLDGSNSTMCEGIRCSGEKLKRYCRCLMYLMASLDRKRTTYHKN